MKELDHLQSDLETKLKKTKGPDRKGDLIIMINNLKVLIHHVNKDFK